MNRIGTRILVGLVAALTIGVVAVAQAADSDTFGKSTLDQRIVEAPGASGFGFLEATGAGEGYTVRSGELGEAKDGRENRRTAISYFGQVTDFQLADEESPARVEFMDPMGESSAWRPNEAFSVFETDMMFRQFNWFANRSPNQAGKGGVPRMDFVMNTGDATDNSQLNETVWVRDLMRGGTINPGSGVDAAPYMGQNPFCPTGIAATLAGRNPALYEGVQKRALWPETSKPDHAGDPAMGYFWDPDEPNPAATNPQWVNAYADAPSWPGLMDRAQQSFEAEGLQVPGYMSFGNHDVLVQGNVFARGVLNDLATGCLKPINDDKVNSGRDSAQLFGIATNPNLTTQNLLDLYAGEEKFFMPVSPDPDRRLISRKEAMQLMANDSQSNGHGFGFVDKAERNASNGFAAYYSFSPRPGIRYISLDTNAHAGKFALDDSRSDNGNLDHPQFTWFEKTLKQAQKANELVVVFSHHAIPSLKVNRVDEEAPACDTVDPAEVPGCDGDPRWSGRPDVVNGIQMYLADDARDLMLKYPNAIAWVAGHSHVNEVKPYATDDGKSGFWSIKTSALADWPKQNRLIEIFDNRDGTVSIFGTLLDHAADTAVPADGTDASGFDAGQLASIGRTVGYNDNQGGGFSCGTCGLGAVKDRNVELLVNDPRRKVANITALNVKPKQRKLKAGKKFKLTVAVKNAPTAAAAAKKLKVRFKSNNRQVKIVKVRTINVAPGQTRRFKVVVRATRKARGQAKITVQTAGRKAVAKVKVKPLRKKKKRR